MPNVSVSTKIFGARDENPGIPKVSLKLVSDRVSAREIISRAVGEQIRAMMQEQGKDYEQIGRRLARQYLEQDEIDEQAKEGKIAFQTCSKNPPDQEAEIKRAIQAFSHKRYKMFVDGMEITRLDQPCTLRDGTAINFMRLIPLIGG